MDPGAAPFGSLTVTGETMPGVNSLNELHEQGKMTWSESERGWLAAPDEILSALSRDGFAACKRESTTSRRDGRPAGGVWQGVNSLAGTVASAIWVNRPGWQQAIVFIDIDGESLREPSLGGPKLPFTEAGGEG